MSSLVPSSDEVNSAVEDVIALLRSRGQRVTTSRRELVRALVEAGGHRTPDELAAIVHGRAPDVHISTIYRNLEELERLGVIEHAHLGHGAATYHLSTIAHGHLVCETCGATIEVSQSLFDTLVKRAKSEYRFTIDPHHFAMVGECSACAASAARPDQSG